MNRIHFVGGEKGGVGKSVLSRVLTQYCIDRQIPFKAFDGDQSNQTLSRFYKDFSESVNVHSFEGADQIVEMAFEADKEIIVDLPAQSSRHLHQWFEESDIASVCDEEGLTITLWHVMDDGSDSVRLLERLVSTFGDVPEYIVVRNHGRGSDFSMFDESEAKSMAMAQDAKIMDLPNLNSSAMLKIDRCGASLWAAIHNKDHSNGDALGILERRRVRLWLEKAYEQLDAVMRG